MESYKYLSSVYDSLMYDVSYDKWAEYVMSFLGEDVKNVIEYACGTGNLSVYFGRKYDMCCLDISEEMLFCAQEKLRQNAIKANFVCEDMSSFCADKKFDAALCMMDGVNYLEDGADEFFASVYKNLKADGIFCFDISSHAKLTKTIGNEMFYDDGEDITYFWQNECDGNKVYMDISIFVKEKGNRYERFDEQHVQRAYKKDEIINSLEKAGFSDIKCFKFLTHKDGKDSDDRIFFAARKGQN